MTLRVIMELVSQLCISNPICVNVTASVFQASLSIFSQTHPRLRKTMVCIVEHGCFSVLYLITVFTLQMTTRYLCEHML